MKLKDLIDETEDTFRKASAHDIRMFCYRVASLVRKLHQAEGGVINELNQKASIALDVLYSVLAGQATEKELAHANEWARRACWYSLNRSLMVAYCVTKSPRSITEFELRDMPRRTVWQTMEAAHKTKRLSTLQVAEDIQRILQEFKK